MINQIEVTASGHGHRSSAAKEPARRRVPAESSSEIRADLQQGGSQERCSSWAVRSARRSPSATTSTSRWCASAATGSSSESKHPGISRSSERSFRPGRRGPGGWRTDHATFPGGGGTEVSRSRAVVREPRRGWRLRSPRSLVRPRTGGPRGTRAVRNPANHGAEYL